MQDNTITLSVNEDGDDGTTAEIDSVFTRFNEFLNRSEYIHANHTLASRDKLGFYRTIPKKVGNFMGTAKSAAKLTKDFLVPGSDSETLIIAPAIMDIGFSFPIGLTPEQTLAFRMRGHALLQHYVVMAALTDKQMI
jgi:hypothetical protein